MNTANPASFSFPASPGSRRRLPFGGWRKPDPKTGTARGLAEALERLALTSPHLLADMGFEMDGGAASPTRTVWRRGRLSVTIERGDVAEVRVETGG